MRITVLLFGVLRESLGRAQEQLELVPEAPGTSLTPAHLVEHLQAQAPALGGLWSRIAVAVNGEYAHRSTPLHEGDEVALLPPVSGGSEQPAVRTLLTQAPIDLAALQAAIKAGPDGAVVTFDGIVRDNTRGRETLYLFYEAYEPMALREMQSLAGDAAARFPVRAITIVHRLGRLGIGETSVAILVASAHRAAAFEACRFLIDTLKRQVPIWKKEHFADGAVWADGEPFPQALVPTGQDGSQ